MVKQQLAQKIMQNIMQKILAGKKSASSSQASSGQATRGQATRGQATSGQATSGRATSGRATSGRAMALALAIWLVASVTVSVTVSVTLGLAYSSSVAKAELNPEQKNQLAYEFIRKNGTTLINIMGNSKISQNKKRQLLKNILEKSLNTNIMTRAIVGKYWRKMDEQQRIRYTLAASQWILLYSANLLSTLNAISLDITNANPIGKDVLIKTKIQMQKNEQPINLDWRVRIDKNNTPTLIDLHIEGLSLISAQRGEAADIIAESGLEKFLAKLDARLEGMKN